MKMKKSEMAVAVAKDVLSQLRRRSGFTVETGSYLTTDYEIKSPEGDLKGHVDGIIEAGCSVCARGALLLIKARMFNHVPMEKVTSTGMWTNECYLNVGQQATTEGLSDVFSESTLNLIESAFEVSYLVTNIKATPLVYGAVVFGSKYKTDKSRLTAIMKNIVENDGKFVVEKATKKEADKAVDKAAKFMETAYY